MRPTLDQIEAHAFFTAGENSLIPKELPESCLHQAPTEDLIAKMRETLKK